MEANCQSKKLPTRDFGKYTNVVCCKHVIEKGRTISVEDLTSEARLISKCPIDPIGCLDIAAERQANRRFLKGHIFTFKDFDISPVSWPIGNNLVLYSLHDIPRGTVIKATDMVQGKWDKNNYPQNAFSNPNIIINRKTRFDIQKGQLICLYNFGLGINCNIRVRKHHK